MKVVDTESAVAITYEVPGVSRELTPQEAALKACWIVGINMLDPTVRSDHQLVTTYKEQGGVERGFRFLKDPLFLASSFFVKKRSGSWT